MSEENLKKPLPPAVAFFASGAFLAAEAGRLLLNFQWGNTNVYLPLISGLLCMVCGFFIVSSGEIRRGGLTGLTGALLLTLHAGAFNHPVSWICSFTLAGGTAAFFTRTRRKNTFIPFETGFIPALVAVIITPQFTAMLSAATGMLLTGVLLVNSVNLKHFRWLLLLLIPVQGLLFNGIGYSGRTLRNMNDLRHTAVAALPSALIPDAPRGNVSVLQISGSRHFSDTVPWKHLPFVKNTVQLAADDRTAPGVQLEQFEDAGRKFDVISVEMPPAWHSRSLQKMLEKLEGLRDTRHGVIAFPSSMLPLFPGKSFPVPGSDGRRFVSGSVLPENLAPENLDRILQQHLEAAEAEEFMPPGVFTALFHSENKIKAHPGNTENHHPAERSWWFWLMLGTLWLAARTLLTRKGGSSAFFASLDNTASVTLVVICAFYNIVDNRMYSNMSELFLLWVIVLMLPCFGRRGPVEKALLLCSMILPWLLTGAEPGANTAFAALAAALISALSAGITSAKLMLETGADRKQLTAASILGILFGTVIFIWLYNPGNIVPLLAIAVALRSSCLLRK